MKKFKAQTLAFVNDFRIPCDNNSAERSIQMLKVFPKINDGWRTLAGTQIQLAFRSRLDTVRKKGQNLFRQLQNILTPKFYTPAK